MARASVRTLLPLDTFARVAGVHPLHWNQVELHDLPTMGDTSTVRTCGMPIFQFQWQTASRTGREDVAEAIAQAEQLINAEIGFKLAPDWTVKDSVAAARPSNVGLYAGSGIGVRGQYDVVRAREGYIISGGVEAKTLIEAAATVVYSDVDGDGYDELATVTAATTVTDINEIALYYPGEGGATEWEIRPLKKVTIAGGVATIECYRQQLVMPELLTTLFPLGVDGVDDAFFLQDVDVYRHYNDPSNQAQLIYDGGAICGVCEGTGCSVCGFGVSTGCMVVRDHRLGMVSYQPGTWDGAEFTAGSYARAPDRLNLNYIAGWRDHRALRPLCDMDPRWARAITYFALSFLSRPVCACEAIEAQMKHWREDLAHSISERGISSSFRIPSKKFDNPFGTTRGALFAWEAIQNFRLGMAADNA